MFRIIAIASHAALVAWFIYLQVHGASIFGSDENTSSSSSHGSSHSVSHK